MESEEINLLNNFMELAIAKKSSLAQRGINIKHI